MASRRGLGFQKQDAVGGSAWVELRAVAAPRLEEDPPAESPWLAFWEEVRLNVLVSALVSLACSATLILLYYRLPRVRRMPGWVMLRATLCEVLVSLGFVALCSFDHDAATWNAGSSRSFIWTLFLLIATGEVSAASWRVVMYLQLVAVYLNPFNPERHRPLYPVVVAAIALITLAGCVAGITQTPNMDPLAFSDACFSIVFWGLVLVPFLTFVIIGCALHTMVLCLVSNALHAATQSGHPASISFLARQRVVRHGTAYMVLHGVQLSVGLVLGILAQYAPGWNNNAVLHTLVTLTCGRPVLSFLGWLAINDIVYIVFGICSLTKPFHRRSASSRRRRRSAVPAGGSVSMPPGSSTVANSSSGFEALDSQPREEDRSERPGAEAEGAVIRTLSALPGTSLFTSAHAAMERRALMVQGIAEDGFKEELRFELLYDVAYGIGELAQRELEVRPPPPSPASAKTSFVQGFGASVTSTEPPLPEPMGMIRTASGGYERTPITTMASRACHYGVPRFRAIREAFGISPSVYSQAFPNDLDEYDDGWRQRLKESVSEGASGSFFYHVRGSSVADNARSYFIVKQISRAEKCTLMRFLPRYEAHVVERRGRSLIQYFGCHSMSLRWRYSGKVYFVVMRNFLPVKQWLVFDLKGATANRRALAANLLHQIHAGADPRGGAVYGTLRDWEWMDIAMVVDISPEDKASLAETIAADAAFLSAQGLLDYSLLVGIHRLPLDLSPEQRESHVRELRASGGFVSLDRQKIYFFGIIDVLERYSLRWRMQHACLTAGYWLTLKGVKADGISAMPPHEYADRFKTFVQKEVLQLAPSSVAQDAHARRRPSSSSPSFFERTCCAFRRAVVAVQDGERWMRLWARRRRGLVRERIEADRADHIRRIQELEGELNRP